MFFNQIYLIIIKIFILKLKKTKFLKLFIYLKKFKYKNNIN